MSKEWRKNWPLTSQNQHVEMGKSEWEESDRLEDDGRSDGTSSRITKCETHIDNYMYHC
jgi:hypothetical protein